MFNKNRINYELDYKGINAIRGLSIDMIDNAKSGHPGICLGAASIVYTLFKRHMNISLENLNFVSRDRFIFSAGHGVPLLYSVLYMLDILTLDDLKSLRKIDSLTPGHPEYMKTPLIETTTGPLGQGVGNAVGISIAEAYLNQKTKGLIDHYTYVLCGDGELEEGVTYEALSLAGTLGLNKLIVFLDNNNVTLDSDLKTSSKEDLRKRFESINFNVIEIGDLPEEVDEAITKAKSSSLPSVIIVKTRIGAYSKNEGKNIVHGKPLDSDDILSIKEKLELHQTPFTISQDVKEDLKKTILERGEKHFKEWNKKYQKSDKEFIDKIINKENIYNLINIDFEYNSKSLRDLSGSILNSISKDFDLLMGGSADLSSSCKTNLSESDIFSHENRLGRNIYFGIREHAMGSIINGMALSGLRPFASTFLAFSDYMRPAIRMSALMNLPVLYIFTHDSITVGEDGPAHHPIEQLYSLELIPNLKVYRPFDLNELIGCYMEIMKSKSPSVLVLPRDNREISNNTKINGIEDGMYVIKDTDSLDYINLLANGEELGIVLEVAKNLEEINIPVRVISAPCLKNVKDNQVDKLLAKKTIGITLGVKEYFYKYTQDVIGIDKFSMSGSKEELLDYFGFTIKKLESKILEILNK